MISFLPSGLKPQGHQHGAAQRPHAGLARQHHAVEHQHRVEVLQGPAVEGGDRRIGPLLRKAAKQL